MKSSLVLYAILCVLFLAAALLPVAAKTKKAPPPVDSRILVASVDVKAGTVTIKYMRDAKEPNHVYTIDGLTVLKVNNQDGKIDDIKSGMVVDKYTERDDQYLDELDVSGFPADSKAAKAKAPAKPKPASTQ